MAILVDSGMGSNDRASTGLGASLWGIQTSSGEVCKGFGHRIQGKGCLGGFRMQALRVSGCPEILPNPPPPVCP